MPPPARRLDNVKARVLDDIDNNKHVCNINLHLRIFSRDVGFPHLPKLLRFYLVWAQQAQLIAAALHQALLGLPYLRRPNYNLLQVPIVKINRNLYAFHNVLSILRDDGSYFSLTLRAHLGQDFTNLGILLAHLEQTADLLLDNYLPPALAKTLREQWRMRTLRTGVPPEGVLELAIQCICASLLPVTGFPLTQVRQILNQHFGAALRPPPPGQGGNDFGTPRIVFIALDRHLAPAAPPLFGVNARYVVGASNLNFPKLFPRFVYEVHRERRIEAMKAIPGTRGLRRRLATATKEAGTIGETHLNPAQAQLMRTRVTVGTGTNNGQAYQIPEFVLRDPCAKCFAIYRNNLLDTPGTYVNRLYDCGEDSWVLKVRGGAITL